MFPNRWVGSILAVAALLAGCGSFRAEGTYENAQHSQAFILLPRAHKLSFLYSPYYYLDYTIEGNTMVVLTPSGNVVGSLKGPSVIFPQVTSANRLEHEVAWHLQGQWMRPLVFPFH